MLYELTNAKQDPKEPRTRMFSDSTKSDFDVMDLVIWLGSDSKPIGFQLSIDELCLTYLGYYRFNEVSYGRVEGVLKTTNKLFEKEKWIKDFKEKSNEIDSLVVGFVLGHLEKVTQESFEKAAQPELRQHSKEAFLARFFRRK